MSKKSQHVKDWRARTKRRIVEAFGGKCCVCGYDKCYDALTFHHLQPDKKELSLASLRASIRSWDYIVKELRKCVMVCANCHTEIHAEVTKVPGNALRFNEEYANYKEVQLTDPCPICGKPKALRNITCSLACASKKRQKVDWDSIDIIELKNSDMSNVDIGDLLGVSDVSVAKRLKKLGWKKQNIPG